MCATRERAGRDVVTVPLFHCEARTATRPSTRTRRTRAPVYCTVGPDVTLWALSAAVEERSAGEITVRLFLTPHLRVEFLTLYLPPGSPWFPPLPLPSRSHHEPLRSLTL